MPVLKEGVILFSLKAQLRRLGERALALLDDFLLAFSKVFLKVFEILSFVLVQEIGEVGDAFNPPGVGLGDENEVLNELSDDGLLVLGVVLDVGEFLIHFFEFHGVILHVDVIEGLYEELVGIVIGF